MKVSSFFKLVEIQTKVASVTPFLLGTVYTLYRYEQFNVLNFFIMLASLLCIDMATTAINNYIDYKKAIRKFGFGYESHNAIVRDQIKESTVVTTIFILITLAITFGIILYINTNVIVLLIGVLSFIVGILYTFGPVPISRTPFGEVLSGGVMGFFIPFLAIYIHVFDQGILNVSSLDEHLFIIINAKEVLYMLLVSVPLACGIANIMLGNNLCDIEDDIENKRYTLPIYIGSKNGLAVYKTLYYIAYISIVVAIILGALPLVSLLALLTFIIVNKNIKTFYEKQNKAETFVLAIKNFIMINIPLIITIGLGIIIKKLF